MCHSQVSLCDPERVSVRTCEQRRMNFDFLLLELFLFSNLRGGSDELVVRENPSEEAGPGIGVTCTRSFLRHLDCQCISVAVDANVMDLHRVSAFLAFFPALFARFREQNEFACFQGFKKPRTIGRGDDEVLVSVGILDHNVHESIGTLREVRN
jgi:hypothetical protein